MDKARPTPTATATALRAGLEVSDFAVEAEQKGQWRASTRMCLWQAQQGSNFIRAGYHVDERIELGKDGIAASELSVEPKRYEKLGW
jgi:hypothetical protein